MGPAPVFFFPHRARAIIAEGPIYIGRALRNVVVVVVVVY